MALTLPLDSDPNQVRACIWAIAGTALYFTASILVYYLLQEPEPETRTRTRTRT